MNTFILHLQSGTQYERIDDAVSFIATNASGSFGIQAGHARIMTALTIGLARFRTSQPVGLDRPETEFRQGALRRDEGNEAITREAYAQLLWPLAESLARAHIGEACDQLVARLRQAA